MKKPSKMNLKSVRIRDSIPDVFFNLCSTANSPKALAAWIMFESGEYLQLVNLDIDPYARAYEGDVDRFRLDYQVVSFFKKFQGFDLDLDREALAFEKWLAAEQSCKVVNEKLRKMWNGTEVPFSVPVIEALCLAKRKIASILGDVNFDLLVEACRFGPGSDMSTCGGSTSAYDKFDNKGSVTPWVLSTIDDVFSEHIVQDFAHESDLVRGNRLSFVRKNAKIDRSICVEPRWNMFLQLGIGELISKRLAKFGVDLSDQSQNQVAASRAYVDRLSTIDLSSASDTVAKNLVVELLSCSDDAWLDLILSSRSPNSFYKGKWIVNEKISSMGNGYTFPLESLIFYSLAFAACRICNEDEYDIRVYGDDIIIPRGAYDTLQSILTDLGFLFNKEKSFKDGNFFESCGEDFFCGVNVRPVLVKRPVTSIVDAYALCNSIVDLGSLWGNPEFLDKRLLCIWRTVLNTIPNHLRFWGPREAGSGVLHTSFDKCRPQRARFGWEGWYLDALLFVPTRFKKNGWRGHLYSKLKSSVGSYPGVRDNEPQAEALGLFITRRDRGSWSRKRVYVRTYTDFSWA